MTSTTESQPRSTEPKTVRRAAVITHGKPGTIGPALERLEQLARTADVELLLPAEETTKHGLEATDDDVSGADLAVVLGGDGTMLRALQRFLGTDVPVIGVNFGRVGFLASIESDELEAKLPRVFAGDYRVTPLSTLEVETDGVRSPAVNDVVVLSSVRGRMVELAWALGGEELGVQACDGMICATPTGSTAYNLSNGGPVLIWGLDAMVVTFTSPHTLHARPLVVGRGVEIVIENRSPDVPAAVLVDGHRVADLATGEQARVRLAPEHSRLAVLPEQTFFTRYGEVFGPGR
jgi:NAD+ kinase